MVYILIWSGCDKIVWQKQLKGEKFYFELHFQAIMLKKTWQQGGKAWRRKQEAVWSHFNHTQEAESKSTA